MKNWDEVHQFVEGAIMAERYQIIFHIENIIAEAERQDTEYARGITSMGKTIINLIETRT